MEAAESVLDAILEEDADEGHGGEDDIEMLDAESLDGDAASPARRPREPSVDHSEATALPASDGGPMSKNRKRRMNKKKNRGRKKGGGGGGASSIGDINRFVLDTCRHLKEKKSYLVWNAVGCLGISVMSDLVNEVDTIQKCGGQKTANGIRFRTGGGILWNILKTREPKAYKEIMAKGKEFERQFRQPQVGKMTRVNETSSQDTRTEVSSTAEKSTNFCQQNESSQNTAERKPVKDRIRIPVSYDDLFEEGEIHE